MWDLTKGERDSLLALAANIEENGEYAIRGLVSVPDSVNGVRGLASQIRHLHRKGLILAFPDKGHKGQALGRARIQLTVSGWNQIRKRPARARTTG